MDKDGEFRRVTEEEYGRVVEYPIPIALLGIEFNGEASRIPGRIGTPLLSADSREAGNALGLLSNVIEHIH